MEKQSPCPVLKKGRPRNRFPVEGQECQMWRRWRALECLPQPGPSGLPFGSRSPRLEPGSHPERRGALPALLAGPGEGSLLGLRSNCSLAGLLRKATALVLVERGPRTLCPSFPAIPERRTERKKPQGSSCLSGGHRMGDSGPNAEGILWAT